MTSASTANLGLHAYNVPKDAGEFTSKYINDVSGSSPGENIGMLDAFAGRTSASLTELNTDLNALYTALSNDTTLSTQISAGSSNDILVTPVAMTYSDYGKKIMAIQMNASNLLTSNSKSYTRIPVELNGWYLTEAMVTCSSSPIDGDLAFMISVGNSTSASFTPFVTNLTVPYGALNGYIWGVTPDPSPLRPSMPTDIVRTGDKLISFVSSSATGVNFAEITLVFTNYYIMPPD
jgi:hypothetical protein